MKRRLTALLTVLVLIPATGIVYLLGSPRLVATTPAAGARDVPAGTALHLEFNRSMQAGSVQKHLTVEPNIEGSYHWEGHTLVFTPTQDWPSGTVVRVHLARGTRAAGWLPFPTLEDFAWNFSVGYPRLAYLWPSDAAANLFILNTRTGKKRQLTNASGGVLEYDVNAAGTLIYYSAQNAQGGSNLYLVKVPAVDQTGEEASALPPSQLILECRQAQCRSPRVSPKGDYLAYERTPLTGIEKFTYPQVWLLPLQDEGLAQTGPSEPTQVQPTLAGEANHQTEQPVWSPNGAITYYDHNLDAFIIQDVQTGQRTRFSNQTGQPGSWNPSGEDFVAPEISILQPGDPNQTGLNPIANSHLILFHLPDKSTKDLSQAEDLEDASPAYSPDGATLAFARKYLDVARWTPGRQLWVMRSDGSQARQLTNDPYFNHFEFAWSPDGGELAFVRFNQTVLTDPPEVWLIDPQTTQARQLLTGAYEPQWVP